MPLKFPGHGSVKPLEHAAYGVFNEFVLVDSVDIELRHGSLCHTQFLVLGHVDVAGRDARDCRGCDERRNYHCWIFHLLLIIKFPAT